MFSPSSALPRDRFVPGAVFCDRRGYVLRAARDLATGGDCTLLLPGSQRAPERFAEVVRSVAAAHAPLTHRHIPKVVGFDDSPSSPFLVFDCPAVLDGIACLELISAGPTIPYEGADAFIASLREAMEVPHAVDPAARCFGRLSLANVLFDARGWWYLVGFGHNFPTEDEAGRVDASIPFFQAPEVAAGGAATPVGDFVALRLLMQSAMMFVDTGSTLGRMLRGDVRPEDAPVLELLLWFEREVMSQVPVRRPSMREIVAMSDQLRAILGVVPSAERYAAHVAALLASRDSMTPSRPSLVLHDQGARVSLPDGVERSFSGAARRILLGLAEAHLEGAQRVLSVWDLIALGWPDEKVKAESATNRTYVTVNRIRAAGLQQLIERVEGGYRLAPALRVEIDLTPTTPHPARRGG